MSAGRTAGKLAPWLRRQLEDQGKIDPRTPGYGPTASAGRCGHRGCRATVLRAIDESTTLPVTADLHPLTVVGEAWALGQRRHTYRLGGYSRRWLQRRDLLHLQEQPPNSTPDNAGPIYVLADHVCGTEIPVAFRLKDED